MKPTLFTYCVLWHPTDKQKKDEDLKSKIIVQPTNVLAVDQNTANMMAVMEVPAEYKGQMEQITVACRPF